MHDNLMKAYAREGNLENMEAKASKLLGLQLATAYNHFKLFFKDN